MLCFTIMLSNPSILGSGVLHTADETILFLACKMHENAQFKR